MSVGVLLPSCVRRIGFSVIALAACASAAGQDFQRQSIEIAGLGQTTRNLETGPYHPVIGVSSFDSQGVNHFQGFGGALVSYSYALSRTFSVEGRVGYLLGHQPTVNQSGGNELLAHFGIKSTVPVGRFALYGRLAPGISSFSDVFRLYHPDLSRVEQRVTHFSLEEGVGAEFHATPHNSLHFDASLLSLAEGDVRTPSAGSVSIFLPGNVESHLLMSIGLSHSFGRSVSSEPVKHVAAVGSDFKNEVILSWAVQPQVHLDSLDLHPDRGVVFSVSRFLRHWLAVDGSLIVLPGGDVENYQDGGTETEAFVGLKAGLRRPRYGLFAKLRPGIASFPNTYNNLNVIPVTHVRTTDFAADYGAVFEVYPREGHLMFRMDAGEVATRYSALKVNTSLGLLQQPQQSREATLIAVGAGWRF